MDVLTLTHVSKKIGENLVLDDISMRLSGGRVYGIVGKNGSGKTMLLRAISGLVRPTSGEIQADGRTLHRDFSVFPSVGIVIENAGLYPEFTGLENLKLLAKINHRISEKEIRGAILKMGLDPDDKRPIRKYSLGMRQRIILAQAIMEQPELLLLDEPTNGLDESGVKLLNEIVLDAKARGAIIILSSHDRDTIRELCDEVFWMESGVLKGAK